MSFQSASIQFSNYHKGTVGLVGLAQAPCYETSMEATHTPEMDVFCSRIDGLRRPAMLNLASVEPREIEGALEARFACGAAFCSRFRVVPSAAKKPG